MGAREGGGALEAREALGAGEALQALGAWRAWAGSLDQAVQSNTGLWIRVHPSTRFSMLLFGNFRHKL